MNTRGGRITSAVIVLVGISFAGLLSSCETRVVQMPTTTPTQLAWQTASGRAQALRIGAARAYWVWFDEDGIWHVRTTAGRSRRFTGEIRPLPDAEIIDVKPVGLRPKAELAMSGRLLWFNFATRNGMDGFDFRVNGRACLEFDLKTDGDGDPSHIYVGKEQIRPGKEHFLLCP